MLTVCDICRSFYNVISISKSVMTRFLTNPFHCVSTELYLDIIKTPSILSVVAVAMAITVAMPIAMTIAVVGIR